MGQISYVGKISYVVRRFLTDSIFCRRPFLLGNNFKFASEIMPPVAVGIRINAPALTHNGSNVMISSSPSWSEEFIIDNNNTV